MANFDLQTSNPNSASSFGFGEHVVTGRRFYVDSGRSNASDGNLGVSPRRPFATIDAAVGKCTASNGDFIYVMPGHNEAVILAAGLALDVAGITIVFLGEGASRAKITFSGVVGADMDVDAEGITLVNPRFVAGLDALTGPIDNNAANFKMYNVLVEDAASMAALDWYIGNASADLLIDGWEYRVSSVGAAKQSNIQIAAATRPVLKHIRITGEFAVGCIENGAAWVDATLDDVIVDNQKSGPVVGILLQSASSGQMRNVNIRTVSGTTYITAANDMQFFNCQGVGVDADGGEQIGAIIATSVEGKIDSIIAASSSYLENAMVTTSMATNNNYEQADNPVVWTVTGRVKIRCWARIVTGLTSTSTSGSMSLGITGNTALLGVLEVADGSAFATGDWWGHSGESLVPGGVLDDFVVLDDSNDVFLSFATNNMTAGKVTFYCEWIPLSSGATVAAAQLPV